MKAQQREKFLNLVRSLGGGCGLCLDCRYAQGNGSLCDGEMYMECNHPIKKVTELDEDGDISTGGDCWGFSPKLPFEDLVTIASVVLINGWDEWAWTKYKGKIHVQTLKQQAIFECSKSPKN